MALDRRKLFKLAQWIFAAVVLFFAARSLATQWNRVELRLIEVRFGWEWIAAATVLILVTYALLIEGWRRILVAWDSHVPFGDAARIWFLSNLGKYVPGNIWSLTAMGVMARRRGLSAIAAAGSSVIMQTVSLATGTAIVMVTSAKLLGQSVLVGATVLLLLALGECTFLAVLWNRVSAFRAWSAWFCAWRNLLVHRSLHRCIHPWFHLADRAGRPGRERAHARRVHDTAWTRQRS